MYMLMCFMITAYNLYSIDMYVFIGLTKTPTNGPFTTLGPRKKSSEDNFLQMAVDYLVRPGQGGRAAGRSPRSFNAQMIGMIGSPV